VKHLRRAPEAVRRLARRVGYRGAFLLMLALVDFSYGRTFLWTEDPGARASNDYLVEVVPVADQDAARWLWALAWWITGMFCLVNAFRRNDRWGFGMAAALKVVYVGAIVIAGGHGMPNATIRGVVWGFFLCLVLLESRRPEPGRDIAVIAEELDTGEVPRAEGHGDA
jgi:hypothetical protein